MGVQDGDPAQAIPDAVLPLLDWGRVLDYCRSDTSLAPQARDRMRSGIELLRGLLGDDYPRRAWQTRHALVDAFIMSGPWYRRFLAARGYAFESLRGIDGFDRLLKQFISSDRNKYSEAVAVSDLASRLQDVGIDVAFERPLTYAESARRPDLRLRFPDTQEVHVEVSLLGDSQASEEADLAASEITRAVFSGTGNIRGCVQLERALSPRHAAHLVTEIHSLRQEAVVTGEFRAIERPGTIRVGLSGPAGTARLETWAGERGLEVNTGTTAGVVEDFGKRVAAKVLQEQRQLPGDGVGILFVPIKKVAFSAGELLQSLATVEEEVYKHHHVVLLVLQWTVHRLEDVLNATDVPASESSELLVEDAPRHQVLVWNKFERQRLSDAAQSLVKRALSAKPELERTSA